MFPSSQTIIEASALFEDESTLWSFNIYWFIISLLQTFLKDSVKTVEMFLCSRLTAIMIKKNITLLLEMFLEQTVTKQSPNVLMLFQLATRQHNKARCSLIFLLLMEQMLFHQSSCVCTKYLLIWNKFLSDSNKLFTDSNKKVAWTKCFSFWNRLVRFGNKLFTDSNN